MRIEPVRSLTDPRLAAYRDVRDARLRDREGLFLVEGRLGVERLLSGSRHKTRSVFVTDTALRALRPLLEPAVGLPVYLAPPDLMHEVVGYPMHRGCLAVAERGEPLDADALLARVGAGRATLLALEDVSNPDNVGGILRNALALGASGALLSAGCADPLYRKSIRVSMGASLRLPWARAADLPGALARLRQAAFRVLALVTDADAEALVPGRVGDAERTVLLLGGEGFGLSRAARAASDARVRIPMAAGVDSLNVATASGIALHHFAAAALRGQRDA